MPVHLRVILKRLLALLLLTSSACAEGRPRAEHDDSTGARAIDSPELRFRAQVGRTWELTRLGDQDIRATHASPVTRSPGRHPGPGSRPTLRFTSEPAGALAGGSGALSAGGWSFCNGYGTTYEVGPGDRLQFHQFQSTLVGCDGPDSLESRFFRALHRTRRFELDAATLDLIAEDGSRLTFVASPDTTRGMTR
jgi:hypothetical protein